MTPVEILVVVALAGTAAFVQSLTGFGFALLIVPPLLLLFEPGEAVVLANLLGTAVAGIMLVRLHAGVRWSTALILIVASLAGMPFGLLVFVALSQTTLQIVIAVTVILFTLLLIRGLSFGSELSRSGSIITGLAAGVLRTSTSMSGPPVVLYLQGVRMASGDFRSTITAFFFISGMGAVAAFALEGTLTPRLGVAGLLAAPAVLVGLYAGGRLYLRVGEARFRGLVFAVLIASALLAIASAARP